MKKLIDIEQQFIQFFGKKRVNKSVIREHKHYTLYKDSENLMYYVKNNKSKKVSKLLTKDEAESLILWDNQEFLKEVKLLKL